MSNDEHCLKKFISCSFDKLPKKRMLLVDGGIQNESSGGPYSSKRFSNNKVMKMDDDSAFTMQKNQVRDLEKKAPCVNTFSSNYIYSKRARIDRCNPESSEYCQQNASWREKNSVPCIPSTSPTMQVQPPRLTNNYRFLEQKSGTPTLKSDIVSITHGPYKLRQTSPPDNHIPVQETDAPKSSTQRFTTTKDNSKVPIQFSSACRRSSRSPFSLDPRSPFSSLQHSSNVFSNTISHTAVNKKTHLPTTSRRKDSSFKSDAGLVSINPLDPYIPGMAIFQGDFDFTPIDRISRFGNSPPSSPMGLNGDSNQSISFREVPSFGQLQNQGDSNIAQRPPSFAHTSPLSDNSEKLVQTKDPKVGHPYSSTKYSQLRQQRRALESSDRQPLPPLHLHLSKDGSSPLPPGWQRAPNPAYKPRSTNPDSPGSEETNMYSYYYYHVKTRQTRWDPPVYPWDADPMDTLTGTTGDDDPEAPYNWGCASKFAVTHDEIEAMYTRIRQRTLERQCLELLHELADKPDVPKGASEQGFAIELYALVHNVLRTYRDARCTMGRILNDEDLYYLTKKLSQAVILKEIQKLRQTQAATSSSLFAMTPTGITPAVQSRVSTYLKRYMECKGAYYRRRSQQAPIPPATGLHPQLHHHGKLDGVHHHHSSHTHSAVNLHSTTHQASYSVRGMRERTSDTKPRAD